ncbi:hypothetical protein BH11BAC1_BH11BAC1_23390 [soil metagenome]
MSQCANVQMKPNNANNTNVQICRYANVQMKSKNANNSNVQI